jgi:hypothetical protein
MHKDRQLDDWLTAYKAFTQYSESPASFHEWVGIGCIAASLQRKVWMTWGHSTIYPNQYIVIVGPSGQSRKGEAITIGRSMIESLGIPMIGEDNSMESIIRDMVTSVQTFMLGTQVFNHSSVCLFAEELAVTLGQQDVSRLAYFTNWYDSRDKWTRRTKHQGHDEVVGMCINLVAATAPDWLPSILPQEAVGGGFTSRVVFVVEEGKRRIVSDPNKYPVDKELKKRLEHDLEQIHLLVGEMHFDKDAQKDYEKWYESEERKWQAGGHQLSGVQFGSYFARRATHVKKIAMALSASRGNDRVVSHLDFLRSRSLLEHTERRMPQVYKGIGTGRIVREVEAVLELLRAKGEISRAEILKVLFRMLDDRTLDEVIRTLEAMRVLKSERKAGGDWVYKYTGDKPPMTH